MTVTQPVTLNVFEGLFAFLVTLNVFQGLWGCRNEFGMTGEAR